VALLPLLAATAYAAMQTMTRRMGVSDSALTLSFYAQAVFLGFSAAFGATLGDGALDPGGDGTMNFLLRAWVWPEWEHLPYFALAGFGTAMGGLLIAQAYRICESALVAPLEYVAMPMAILWGVLVFGQWPDGIAWIGIGLILSGGLYMIFREARANRN
jgi:drug/metabolite transporter (DMT)-like permease